MRVNVKILYLILGASWFFGGPGVEPVWAHQNHAEKHDQHVASPAPAHNDGSKETPVSIGATVYQHMCVFCHGADGNGGGKTTDYLFPWPRDFRKGIFKHRSTPPGSLPVDADIYKTIFNGIPGTAMPAWEGALSEAEIRGVVEYLKTFSKRFSEEKPASPIIVGTPPPATPDTVARGAKLFVEQKCNQCHGSDLRGDGPESEQLYDIWDHRAFVYDLTNPNSYKWGFEKKDVYLTLATGVEGTPMKAFADISDADRWSLVDFVLSKLRMERYQPAKHESDLRSQKVSGEISLDPNHELWSNVPTYEVHMLPLSARKNPINRIKVQSVVNDREIAFRVEWDDETHDQTSSRHQDFKDSVALEFALGDVVLHEHGHNEPFFGMGNRGKVVNIWQWRADWQQDIETKEKLEYATKGMDMDVMIFGGEVNPVDSLNPFREVPVEELNSEGFGTLTPQPRTKQNIKGKGVWKDGKWRVVFTRMVESPNKWDVKFDNKLPILISFAIWDGAYQDRNGRKVVAMWQRLHLP